MTKLITASPTFLVHLYSAIIHLSAVSRFQTKALCEAGKGWGCRVERWSDRKQWKIRAMMRRPHSLPISNLSLFRPFQSCGFYVMCSSDNGGNGGEVRVKRLGACGLKDKRSSTPWSFQIFHFSDAFNLVVSLCFHLGNQHYWMESSGDKERSKLWWWELW